MGGGGKKERTIGARGNLFLYRGKRKRKRKSICLRRNEKKAERPETLSVWGEGLLAKKGETADARGTEPRKSERREEKTDT